ncbi:hypothetical protein FCM35_KLT19100 [Carex littledalei]|uniref:Uncharacterized protein n=1 Tax=Carex littledalei TaxID=544730 RepID=A0A833RKT7_9POAL|nr:hypothetical protein FCM35_KLT19100 [Carex littledalei]
MDEAANNTAGSDLKGEPKRKTAGFTKAQIVAMSMRNRGSPSKHSKPPLLPKQTVLPPLREDPEIEANLSPVADPHPVASQPPPSDASQPKLPLPNSTEVVATVPLTNPAQSETQKKPVRGRATRNISSTARPLRRSSRLNPSSTVLEDDPSDKGTPHARPEPEPSKTEPSKAEPPKSMPTPSFVTEQCDATIPTDSVPSAPSSPADPESGQILDSPQGVQTINLSSTVLEDVIADEVPPPPTIVATAQEQGVEKGPEVAVPLSTPSASPSPPQSEAGHSDWSTYRHTQKLASEKGSAVGLKEVFDRMHMKESPSGKVYVNEKAQLKMQKFEDLKRTYGEVLTDECLWELAVDGDDGRGRLFGFGNRSRTCRVNRALAAEDATMSDAGRSTATSAESERERFTKAQVAELLAAKLAEERRAFASELAAQEKRHREDFERQKKNDEYNRECIAALFRLHGQTLPPPNVVSISRDGYTLLLKTTN